MIEPEVRGRMRLAGLAGIAGAIGWSLGDALLLGTLTDLAAHPVLQNNPAQVDPEMAAMMVAIPEPTLAAGALIGQFGVVLYFAGIWHLCEGLKPAAKWMRWPVFVLLFCGTAFSPLAHAGFYFTGMAYKTLAASPEAAHGLLLDLSISFYRVLMTAWWPAIGCGAVGLLLLAVVIVSGKTSYPRWAALVMNPVSMVLIGVGIPLALPEPARTWLQGAGFNIGFLAVYLLSTVVLWNGGKRRIAPVSGTGEAA